MTGNPNPQENPPIRVLKKSIRRRLPAPPDRKSNERSQSVNLLEFHPQLIIFDIDGVLVDVHGSFHRTVIDTVRFFTGKRVTRAELYHWKNRSGFNDDWTLSTAWVQSLGGKFEYPQVKAKFEELYWGKNGKGNVTREKWLLPRAILERLAKRSHLALFTGRVRKETAYTLDRLNLGKYFGEVVTVEDVEHPKPHAEGLLKILRGRNPRTAVYIGDNVDDARAARSAGIPFVAILSLSRKSAAGRARAAMFKELGAIAILRDVRELEVWLKRAISDSLHRRAKAG
jgi:HAD superfamily phosphatase